MGDHVKRIAGTLSGDGGHIESATFAFGNLWGTRGRWWTSGNAWSVKELVPAVRCLRIFVSITALGLALAACSQSSAARSQPTAAPSAAPPTSASATTPTPSAPPVSSAGQVLFDRSGSGNYRSNTFKTSGEWDLIWEATSAPDTIGSFVAITVFDGDGGPVAGTIEIDLKAQNSKKNDTVHMHYAGTVSIDVQGVGSWHIKAVGT